MIDVPVSPKSTRMGSNIRKWVRCLLLDSLSLLMHRRLSAGSFVEVSRIWQRVGGEKLTVFGTTEQTYWHSRRIELSSTMIVDDEVWTMDNIGAAQNI